MTPIVLLVCLGLTVLALLAMLAMVVLLGWLLYVIVEAAMGAWEDWQIILKEVRK